MNTSNQTIAEKAALSLFSPDIVENQFPVFAQMRTEPVVPVPAAFPGGSNRRTWVVTRMEEAVQILKDHAHFTVDRRNIVGNNPLGPGRRHRLYYSAQAHAQPAPERSPREHYLALRAELTESGRIARRFLVKEPDARSGSTRGRTKGKLWSSR